MSDLDLTSRIIVLDPGHNGSNFEHLEEISRLVDIGNGSKACNTTGTETGEGYSEARVNWEITQRVSDLLESFGAEVLLTRTDNDGWGPCLDQRATVGNDAGADAVISIHADGGPVDGRGFHVIAPEVIPGLTDDIAERSFHLAEIMRDALTASGIPPSDYVGVDGIARRDDLGGLNLSNVPIVFVELGNMRNPQDAAILTDASGQEAIAEAIFDGIVRATSVD